MKKLYGTIIFMLVMIMGARQANAQNVGWYGLIKSNINKDLGFDLGVTFADRFGVKVGIMSDIYRPIGNDDSIKKYKEAIGKKYRLSYTAGPTVKVIDCLWISASIGYGEYGTYAYSKELDMYGISGKIKGLETGLQLRFSLNMCDVEVGYGTIPKGFSLKKPMHDITLGFGVHF